eukprot:766973-Hanusia_phi.AAC.7
MSACWVYLRRNPERYRENEFNVNKINMRMKITPVPARPVLLLLYLYSCSTSNWFSTCLDCGNSCSAHLPDCSCDRSSCTANSFAASGLFGVVN